MTETMITEHVIHGEWILFTPLLSEWVIKFREGADTVERTDIFCRPVPSMYYIKDGLI